MERSVVIDCFPASAQRYTADHVVVAVDVIRATTMAVTALALGRRCLLATDVDAAFALRARLGGATLAGELHGNMPDGFDLNNSPAALEDRREDQRDLIMLSTSGSTLMLAAGTARAGAFAACFRNHTATARALAGHDGPIAIIGAGSRSEFREEDQMCCAWIAAELLAHGYSAADARTLEIVERWRAAPAEACDVGNSVAYLRRSGQLADRDFIVSHVNDLEMVCAIEGNEVRPAGPLPVGVRADARRRRAPLSQSSPTLRSP